MSESNFSAKEPSLGYYYQLRLALFLILTAEDSASKIRIECLDDIEIEDINGLDLYQTKYHIKSVANLTNASSDFWKTIRVWSEGITNGTIEAATSLFTLMTTATIGEGSFIEKFKENSPVRDSDTIVKSMLETASTSISQSNKSAYEAFQKLSNDQQKALVANIMIIDNTLNIEGILVEIKKQLRYTAAPKKLDSLIERLEGWWFQGCIHILLGGIDSISQRDVSLKISDINDTLKEDNLPDDFGTPLDIDESRIGDYNDRIFVNQLRLVAARQNVVRSAVNDFHRAFLQRSKWMREELTNISDEDSFNAKLYDHWNNIFSLIKDECEDLEESELQRIGYEFYKRHYIEKVPPIRIRERFSSEYLTRGSCHMLSDNKRIGWHPKFDELL